MPHVDIKILRGASREQKSALIRQTTDMLVTVLGKTPEQVNVVIQEVETDDWGWAGRSCTDLMGTGDT